MDYGDQAARIRDAWEEMADAYALLTMCAVCAAAAHMGDGAEEHGERVPRAGPPPVVVAAITAAMVIDGWSLTLSFIYGPWWWFITADILWIVLSIGILAAWPRS